MTDMNHCDGKVSTQCLNAYIDVPLCDIRYDFSELLFTSEKKKSLFLSQKEYEVWEIALKTVQVYVCGGGGVVICHLFE